MDLPHTRHSKAFCQTETIVQDPFELATVLALRRVKASGASCSVSSLNKGVTVSAGRSIENAGNPKPGQWRTWHQDKHHRGRWQGECQGRGGCEFGRISSANVAGWRCEIGQGQSEGDLIQFYNSGLLPTNLILNNPACKVNCQGAPSGEEYRQERWSGI